MDSKQVIGLFVAILLFAILVPIAFTMVYGVDTTGWSDELIAVWYLIPPLSVVAVVVAIAVALVGRGTSVTNYAKGLISKYQTKTYNSLTGVTTLVPFVNMADLNAPAIIGLFMVLLLFAILMPVAFTLIVGTFNSTGPSAWRGKPYVDIVLSLGGLIPLVAVIAFLIGLAYLFYTRSKR